ncbi:MAG: sulfotransferase [Desulfobacterales bacterium]|nr:sulfotransferase [Desulfobacterales bacterium]
MFLNKLKYLIWQITRKNFHINSFPKNILIVLTSPRSGSTWFSDAIRCHPMIQYWPYGTTYAHLGLSGRRYPRDLSNGPDSTKKIEVLPFKWEKIPDYQILQNPKHSIINNTFLIEKCHPEFFCFDTIEFIERVKQLEAKNVKINFIYQVREPKATFSSFMDYQERNSSWYPSTKGIKLLSYMDKTFTSIYELSLKNPGIVVDFSDIMLDLGAALNKVYNFLWPDLNSINETFNQKIINFAVEATARDKRTKSSFLDKEVGQIKGGRDKYKFFFELYENDITNCCDQYESLLNLK